MAAKEASKTRTSLIHRFRKRLSVIRGGRQGRDHQQRPLSPASILDFPNDDVPSSPMSSPTIISDVTPRTTEVPYDPESMAASPGSSLLSQHEVFDKTVEQTPHVTIHIRNKVSTKQLSANSNVKARISSNTKTNDGTTKTKQKLFHSPVPASVQSPSPSSVEDETDLVTQTPPTMVTDKPHVILSMDPINVSSSPSVASIEAAKANSTAPTNPTTGAAAAAAAAPKPDGEDNLIGRKVRILKHPKDKRYESKIGIIAKQVRKNMYKVEFVDDTDLVPIDKMFKTMELLPADRIEPEQVLMNVLNDNKPKVILPTDVVNESSPQPVTSVKAAEANSTAPANPAAAAAAAPKPNGEDNLIGCRVRILKHPKDKRYMNKVGYISQKARKNTYTVEFEDNDLVPINKKFETMELLPADEIESTEKRRSVTHRSQPMSYRIFRGRNKKAQNPFQSGDHWRVPDSERGGIRLGRRRITKIRTSIVDNTRGTTLLSHLLGNRVLEHDSPITEFELEEPFAQNLEQGGRKYELVATKVHADGDKGSAMYCKPKILRLTYAEVKGPSLENFSMADYLERLANFSALEPRKAKARLELLQSPAHMLGKNQPAIFHLPDDTFTMIQDNGESQGCGFISEHLLESMFGNNAQAKRIVQIQVRIIVPKLGLFKGTLIRGRDVAGIQLFPSSMRKVPASVHPNAFDGGVLLICQGGVHPSPINEYIARRLDPNSKPPPEKSFKSKIKPLSDMITRLWLGMGVPHDVCSVYAKNSRSTKHINHAWVCGATDFSNRLPPGQVFVTGLSKANLNLDEIFVTRSPCMEPTDGRMLPLVKLMPEEMRIEDWAWLNNLPFGSIIFADPPEGMKTLPEHIADGDLDGDRYFICWDPTVLDYIKAVPIADVPVPSLDNSTGATNTNSDWFGKAQDWMLASATIELKIQQLTGKLFSLSNEIADESSLYNKDPDAIASAAAYKQALDVGKHGGPIFLPAHLHNKLPEALRPYVTGTK